MDAEDPLFPVLHEDTAFVVDWAQILQATQMVLQLHVDAPFSGVALGAGSRLAFIAVPHRSETMPNTAPRTMDSAAISAGLVMDTVVMGEPVTATVPTVDAKPHTITGRAARRFV